MPILRLIGCLTLLCTLLGFPNIQPIHAASTILIGEISWAGSSRSTADEWIEIWNASDEKISLAGWSLRGAADGDKIISLPTDASIPPHGTYLISNYAAEDSRSVLAIQPHVVTTTIALSNSILRIQLFDANNFLVDEAGDGQLPPAGASLPTKTSMVRELMSRTWKNNSTSINLVSGVMDIATPGVCDDCQPILNPTSNTSEIPPAEVQQEPPQTEANTSSETTNQSTTSTEIALETTTTTAVEPLETLLSTSSTSHEPSPQSVSTGTLPISPEISETNAETFNPTPSTTTTANNETNLIETPTPSSTETGTAENPTEITTPIIETSINTSIPLSTVNPLDSLRLNEFMPNPDNEKEWIEIATQKLNLTTLLKDCELRDATGVIFKFTESDQINPTFSQYLRVELSSAKLNNDGDTLSLYAPDGHLIDSIVYLSSSKGKSWIRFPDKTGNWEETTTPTPGDANQKPLFEETEAVTTTNTNTTPTSAGSVAPASPPTPTPPTSPVATAPSPVINTTPPTTPLSNLPPKAAAKVILTPARPKTTTAKQIASKAPSSIVKKATKTETKQPTKPKTTTSTKKSTVTSLPILPFTEDMLINPPDQAIRVRVTGLVATPPGLLSTHSFILMNTEGRGLRINLPKKQPLPKMGQAVTVVGKLEFNNNNVPHITVGAKDSVTKNKQDLENPKPRLIDLLTYTNEDVWGLVQVSGTVLRVQNKRIHLDIDGVETDIIIRPPVEYRAARLQPGDIIQVTGILDTSNDLPRILPRTAEEIQLLQHVQPKLAATNSPTPQYPSWAPVGAAAGIVMGTEAVKTYKRRRDIKRLEAKLAAL